MKGLPISIKRFETLQLSTTVEDCNDLEDAAIIEKGIFQMMSVYRLPKGDWQIIKKADISGNIVNGKAEVAITFQKEL